MGGSEIYGYDDHREGGDGVELQREPMEKVIVRGETYDLSNFPETKIFGTVDSINSKTEAMRAVGALKVYLAKIDVEIRAGVMSSGEAEHQQKVNGQLAAEILLDRICERFGLTLDETEKLALRRDATDTSNQEKAPY
ncbi:MAG TPA: hypothetical protein VIT68_04255, partial [Candidatus Gracilibacteria bacterium]